MQQPLQEGTYKHPQSKETVTGVRLIRGIELKPNDVYLGDTGWVKCPIPGTTLGDVRTIWIRPAKKGRTD